MRRESALAPYKQEVAGSSPAPPIRPFWPGGNRMDEPSGSCDRRRSCELVPDRCRTGPATLNAPEARVDAPDGRRILGAEARVAREGLLPPRTRPKEPSRHPQRNGVPSLPVSPSLFKLAVRWSAAKRPDRQEASGLQFTTDFGLRARTPCRLPSHQSRKGASRMLRSLTAKRCRYQARPRGTCLASARRSPANSCLKPNRGYSWMTLWRTASGISLLRRPNTSTAAPADRR